MRKKKKQVTLAVKQYKWSDQGILRHETKSYQHDFCKYTHILNWKLLKVLLKCLLIYACNYSFAHLALKLWSKVQQVLYGDPIQHNMSSIDVIINIFCYLSKSWWKDAVICLSFMFPSWILVLKLSELVLF